MCLKVSFLIGMLATPVLAETIETKYAGPVDLGTYECQHVTRSSLVNRVCFDASAESMVVLLKTTYYAYCGIPQPVVSEFLAAPSMGRFYNQRIKSDAVGGIYACQN